MFFFFLKKKVKSYILTSEKIIEGVVHPLNYAVDIILTYLNDNISTYTFNLIFNCSKDTIELIINN